MITLNFYTFQERVPKHGEEIIFLENTPSGFFPKEGSVEYCWFGVKLDSKYPEEFYYTGEQVTYYPDGGVGTWEELVPGYIVREGEDVFRLEMMVGNNTITSSDLWCPVEEYWRSFNLETDFQKNL